MTVRLDSQKSMRPARQLPFCYLCGVRFAPGEKHSRDHVPPQALFNTPDHDFPLTLRTHPTCNADQLHDDELIGQLVQLLWRDVEEKPERLDLRGIRYADGTMVPGLFGPHLDRMIFRWIRAFHAALYREHLPFETPVQLCLPVQEARVDEASGVVRDLPIPEFVRHAVSELKSNRTARNVDLIACNNRKLRYECVWGQDAAGTWVCAFGLDVYNWAELGDTAKHSRRGCCGFYRRAENAPPIAASSETRLVYNFENASPLDPFGM